MNRAPLDFIAPLFVPADRPERFAKAAASGADAVIVDLEDAVASEAKSAARSNLRTDFTDLPVLVRVNAIGSAWHTDDLAAVLDRPFAAIVIPKAEMTGELENVCRSLARVDCPVVALVETARGIVTARQVAELSGVARLAFGSIDFCADLGCAHTWDALLPARFEMVLASRLANIPPPLDGVTTAIDDPAEAEADARRARDLGFSGKLCIHPRQISAVFKGFSPTPAEIAWAEEVMKAGPGAVSVRGAMVDEPVRLRARSILRRAAKPAVA